eukprot:11713623-Karenia_brevis.AAC.1
MYGSIEWPCIRAAIHQHFACAEEWTVWAHGEASVVQLPGGEALSVDRGAEQGDPFAPLQASLALGEQVLAAREALRQDTVEDTFQHRGVGAVDEWFIDDGQAFVRPSLADRWLRTFDRLLQQMGASRTCEGPECKSLARLLCPREVEPAYAGWDTAYIRNTCLVRDASEAPK